MGSEATAHVNQTRTDPQILKISRTLRFQKVVNIVRLPPLTTYYLLTTYFLLLTTYDLRLTTYEEEKSKAQSSLWRKMEKPPPLPSRRSRRRGQCSLARLEL